MCHSEHLAHSSFSCIAVSVTFALFCWKNGFYVRLNLATFFQTVLWSQANILYLHGLPGQDVSKKI